MVRSHLIACALICLSTSTFAQLGGIRLNWNMLKAGSDAVSAASLTDAQVVAYTKQARRACEQAKKDGLIKWLTMYDLLLMQKHYVAA